MTEIVWWCVAWFVSREPIANWLIRRAKRTPYFHLDGYMNRWWLFNGYPPEREKEKKYSWLPSIRIHHILREDFGRDPHDHPWDARTTLMKGWYVEEREKEIFRRERGDTATLNFGEYHNITHVSDGGVWTFFITYKYRGGWGFLVDGKKIPWQEYEGTP